MEEFPEAVDSACAAVPPSPGFVTESATLPSGSTGSVNAAFVSSFILRVKMAFRLASTFLVHSGRRKDASAWVLLWPRRL